MEENLLKKFNPVAWEERKMRAKMFFNYMGRVAKKIGKKEAIQIFLDMINEKVEKWITENQPFETKVGIKGNDAIAGRELLEAYYYSGATSLYMPPEYRRQLRCPSDTPERTVSRGQFCSNYKAMNANGFTCTEICGAELPIYGKILKALNPKLKFYFAHIKDEDGYCEGVIEVEK